MYTHKLIEICLNSTVRDNMVYIVWEMVGWEKTDHNNNNNKIVEKKKKLEERLARQNKKKATIFFCFQCICFIYFFSHTRSTSQFVRQKNRRTGENLFSSFVVDLNKVFLAIDETKYFKTEANILYIGRHIHSLTYIYTYTIVLWSRKRRRRKSMVVLYRRLIFSVDSCFLRSPFLYMCVCVWVRARISSIYL